MISSRLNALHTANSQMAASGQRSPVGTWVSSITAPLRSSTNTATAWPASFAAGVSTPKSSTRPTSSVSVPASRRPSRRLLNENTSPSATR